MENQNGKIINETFNGRLYTCNQCKQVHLDYKNLSFSFSVDEYKRFRNYILNLNEEYWATINQNIISERKIKIPISHRNLVLSFSTDEIKELKLLFDYSKKASLPNKLFKHSGINLTFSAN